MSRIVVIKKELPRYPVGTEVHFSKKWLGGGWIDGEDGSSNIHDIREYLQDWFDGMEYISKWFAYKSANPTPKEDNK